jgi:hypothetical protein
LGFGKTEIFLQRGLDRFFAEQPVGQIRGVDRTKKLPAMAPIEGIIAQRTATTQEISKVGRRRSHLDHGKINPPLSRADPIAGEAAD